MELKHKWMTGIGICLGLLIVPYGIETPQMALPYESASLLLIVPYGIETVFLN